ncbi:hypothetical protein PA598K_01967 [Paenibacillus sp. 598K]|uniref:glycoside hydrolase family 53 protein n=1 Tax=Paenibacillus sp. 598K TaxID=1117987 RepID=UPI000FF95853|nr:glycosyl hydrolase 53 family protein [Paenibacillus sp. 598K]GBF73659.1 hypothetical protein PA598K_01967 [Paenibacillus sp. 598K]
MTFFKGVDISIQQEIEQLGAKYYDQGKEGDAVQILASYGVNAARLRLWHHPYDESGQPYGGGTNDLAATIALARRTAQHGMQFMLDMHYSDFWADPTTQVKPKAWQELTGTALEDAVYRHTYDTLQALGSQGLAPELIQIGNEITNGLLWPDGSTDNRDAMIRLLAAGVQAAKDCQPEIRTIIHLDWGGDNALYRRWFDPIAEAGLDYDIIGMSYYPFWHGTMEQLRHNMNDVTARYDKDVLIAETAFPFTTEQIASETMIFTAEHADTVPYTIDPQGQLDYMVELMQTIQAVEGGRGLGFFYWEPTWANLRSACWAAEPGTRYLNKDNNVANVWANLALFDLEGHALPALQAIREFK